LFSSVSSSSSSSSSAQASKDESAMSKSRAPFKMPKNAPDDSNIAEGALQKSWTQIGLWPQLIDCLQNELQLESPTAVQQLVLPKLLFYNTANAQDGSLAFFAATGSGKTLAYLLPLLQALKQYDTLEEARASRPRLLILAPTRELANQILTVTKQLCHALKLSSCGVFGGHDYGQQKRALSKRVDILVASPGRLLKHWKQGNVFLGQVETVVLDEMDTMLEQGFQSDLRQVLYPILYHKTSDIQADLDWNGQPRIVLTSATMTRAVQRMIGDTDALVQAKNLHRNLNATATVGKTELSLLLPTIPTLKAPGLHKAVPRLQQTFVDVGSTDKLSLLVDVLGRGGSGAAIASSSSDDETDSTGLTLVFCNTAASCQAVQYALSEARIETLAYHGELNSAVRSENLKAFREASNEESRAKILVCTDLAAR
jgi:superfamily II DNA/RNA helicase